MLIFSPSMKLCKDDNIKEVGLQKQKAKVLYLKKEVRYTLMRVL